MLPQKLADMSSDWYSIISRHGNDIDKAHERVRIVSHELDNYKTRLTGMDSRMAVVEAKLNEQRDILTIVNEHVLTLKATQESLVFTINQAAEITTKTNLLVQDHVKDEISEFSKQTKRVEAMSRYLILVFTVIGSLVVVLGAIHQHLTGSSIFASIGQVLAGLVES